MSAEVPVSALLEQMPAFLWITDSDLRITSNWGSGMQLAKIRPGELIGRTAYEILKFRDAQAATLCRQAMAFRGISSRFEFKLGNRDFEIRLEPLRGPGGSIVGWVGAGIDITERKRGEEQFRYQATHDGLTGLANYREFLNALEREVRRAERAHHSFAVLLLDLDDLKRINDRWGHLTGNRALRRLAEVLKEHCRTTDLAARYGGDEFAVLLIDADPAMARQIAQRVEKALDKDREEPRVRVCIGFGVYPDDGRSARELLEAADQKLYKRKKGAHSQIASAGGHYS
jgi:diguanylate cyclase (GGDEF)-like protein